MKRHTVPAHDKLITIRVPASAWQTLRETLALDAQSKAFDPVLRRQIGSALEQVTELRGSRIVDFGHSESMFVSVLAQLSREGYKAMFNGSTVNVQMLRVVENPDEGDKLVVLSPKRGGFKVSRISIDKLSFIQV